jgi:hypothetical protein
LKKVTEKKKKKERISLKEFKKVLVDARVIIID